MNIVTTLVGAATVGLIGGAALPAQAGPLPVHPVDHVACFVHAEGPFKSNYGSIAPIGYGFKVHCTPHEPDLRHIHVKLWRKDLTDGGRQHLHSEQLDNSTTAEVERTYYASCSGAAVQYEFHTEVDVDVWYGEWDHASGNSDGVLLNC